MPAIGTDSITLHQEHVWEAMQLGSLGCENEGCITHSNVALGVGVANSKVSVRFVRSHSSYLQLLHAVYLPNVAKYVLVFCLHTYVLDLMGTCALHYI